MAYGPPFYGIRTPPFMPYEPFLLGVGVVFNLLTQGVQVRYGAEFLPFISIVQCPGRPVILGMDKNRFAPSPNHFSGFPCFWRRRTNVQQLTCKMVWSSSFYSFFVLTYSLSSLWTKTVVKPLMLRKTPGGKILKNSENVWKCVEKCQKVWKSDETILPFSCCPFGFSLLLTRKAASQPLAFNKLTHEQPTFLSTRVHRGREIPSANIQTAWRDQSWWPFPCLFRSTWL